MGEKSADGNLHRCATDEGPAKVEAGTHEKKVINIDLEALRKKMVEEDCPSLMKTLELPNEPIPLWWTADMINGSLGECWTAVPVAEQKSVVGEFNCSCVGISKCLPAYCKPDTPNVSWKDIPAEAAKMLGVCSDEKLKEIFEAIDVNKNGTIEVKEFGNALKSLGMEITDDSLQALFKSADVNQDGVLQFDEYKRLVCQL